jgi:hypothetical protein
MFQMFQVFHTYVASVSSGGCKSRSGCAYVFAMNFKCFRVFLTYVVSVQLFQTYIASVSTVSDVYFKCFLMNVAKVNRNVAHIAVEPTCYRRLSLCWGIAVGHHAGAWGWQMPPQVRQVTRTHVGFPREGATVIGRNRSNAMVGARSSVGSMWWGV